MNEHDSAKGANGPSDQKQSETNKEPCNAAASSQDKTTQEDSTDSTKQTSNKYRKHTPANVARRCWRFLRHIWHFALKPEHANAVLAIVTILIFVTGCAYTIFACLQWRSMEGQVEQMKAGNRPWIGIDPDTGLRVSEIRIGEKETATVTMNVTIKNFGSYPGKNVVALAWLMVIHDSMYKRVIDKITSSCTGGTNYGAALFPGATITREWDSRVTNAEKIRDPADANDPIFVAYVVGCIGYQDEAGFQHHTGFAYRDQLVGRNEAMTFATLRPDRVVPKGEWVQWFSFVD